MWTTEGTKVFERGGGDAVKEEARKKEDYELLRRISGFDLFCCEAKYHPTWRNSYMNKPDARRSKDDTQVHIQAALEAAHKETFKKVM